MTTVLAYKSIVLLVIALLTSSFSNAGEANLSWTPPQQNEDGTPLIDLTSYEIWHGCSQSGAYDTVEIVLAPASSHTVLNLPDVGTCYFAAKATNSSGESSVFSNEATRIFSFIELPGSVNDTEIFWQESIGVPVAIGRTALAADFDAVDGTEFTTASYTPSANKLVLAYITGRPSGSTGTVSLSGNGLTWVLVEGEKQGIRYSAIWRAMGASPSTEALTITFTDNMRSATWEISEFDNVDV